MGGHFNICRAWSGISRGMIMHQNNSRRASVKYQLYNFTRENSYPVNRAFK